MSAVMEGYAAAQRNYDRQSPPESSVDDERVYLDAKADRLVELATAILKDPREAANIVGYMAGEFDPENDSAAMRLVRALASKNDAATLEAIKVIYNAALNEDAEYTALRAVDNAYEQS